MSWWLGDVATTREALRERLVKGQKNLTLGVERLSGMKDAGIGSDFEKEFLEWFEKWIRFEQQARIVGLEGCIHGDEERCPQDVAVRCESCGYGREEVKAKDGVRVGFIYHDTIRWVLLKPNLRVRDHKYRTRPGWATERSHIELLKEKAQGGAGLVRLKTDAGVFESSLQLWLEKASPPPGPESDQLMLDDRYWVEVQDVDGGV